MNKILLVEDDVEINQLVTKYLGKEGFDILMGTKRTTPVIILSAKDNEIDKILGLELGVDDYITKPFTIWGVCCKG